MRSVILILAWVTPAAIAGVLGWSGIWGTGSAFGDYLLPIPVAGGVLHVPSFLIAAAVILMAGRQSVPMASWFPVVAFAVFVGMVCLALDYERLNAWLFTDYEPYGSPVRLTDNPLYLFMMTDALWVGIYTLVAGYSAPPRWWLALPLVACTVMVLRAATYQFGGPVFEIGGSTPGTARGDELEMVYTSASYDEALFRNWLDELGSFGRPWENPNSEHVAIVFTNSMQAIKWRRFDEVDSDATVGTFCLYEEDRSMIAHPGYYDCFAGRNTVDEDLAELLENESTGLGTDIDQWFARVRLCDGVDYSGGGGTDIARVGVCRGMARVHPRDLNEFISKYGASSPQVDFVRTQAAARGLSGE